MLIVKTGKKTHFEDMTIAICHLFPHMAPGTDFLGVVRTPEMICTPPPQEAFGTAPKSFCTPTNYIYFDLIVSYLIILTTKFVKLPILWSQISPCRPKTNFVKLFPWPFRALPPRPGQSKQQHPPRYLSTPPKRKYENPSLHETIFTIALINIHYLYTDLSL
jgi:hypothetical protein